MRIYSRRAASRLLDCSLRTLVRALDRAAERAGHPIGTRIEGVLILTDEDLEAARPFVYHQVGNPHWKRWQGTLLIPDRPPAAPVSRPKRPKPAKPPKDSPQSVDT